MRRRCLLLYLLCGAAFGEVRYHHGDDPRWAARDLDETDWQISPDGFIPFSNSPDHMMWVRTRVPVPDNAPAPDALLWPEKCGSIGGPAELFVNGVRIASVGKMPPRANAPVFPRDCVFPVPKGVVTPGQTTNIALRSWSGLRHRSFSIGEVRLGIQDAMRDRAGRLRGETRIGAFPHLVFSLLLTILACVLLFLWKVGRGTQLLYWFSIWLLFQGISFGLEALVVSVYINVDVRRNALVQDVLSTLEIVALLELQWAAYALRRNRLLALSELICALACIPAVLLNLFISFPYVSGQILGGLAYCSLLVVALYGLFKPGEGRWTALCVLLYAGVHFGIQFALLPYLLTLNPVAVTLPAVCTMTIALVVSAILVRRTWIQWRTRERLEGEIVGAQAVQAALMPAQAPSVPGFEVEAVYLPAEEVGGDFYRFYSCDGTSSVIVAGDVSGKGLRAAMIASIVSGAVEAVINETTRPADILGRVNRVLTGRLEGGFVTCCCLHLGAAGTYTLANAGHVIPYAGGVPIAVESGLPLGIDRDAVWTETAGVLGSGETIVLLSDGVVEARRPGGELYGFERVEADLADFHGAAALADKAREFGQDDDITVLAITRREAGAHAA